jgi:hypothetical protein
MSGAYHFKQATAGLGGGEKSLRGLRLSLPLPPLRQKKKNAKDKNERKKGRLRFEASFVYLRLVMV